MKKKGYKVSPSIPILEEKLLFRHKESKRNTSYCPYKPMAYLTISKKGVNHLKGIIQND
jgi:hypothetical protein